MTFDRFAWMNGWVDDESLSGTAVAVLAVLLRHMGQTGEAWPSVATIGAKAGFANRKTIYAAISEIEKAGWLEVERTHGSSSTYRAKMSSGTVKQHQCRETAPVPLNGCTNKQHQYRETDRGCTVSRTGVVPFHGTLTEQEQTNNRPVGSGAGKSSGDSTQIDPLEALPPTTHSEPQDSTKKLLDICERYRVQLDLASVTSLTMNLAGKGLTTEEMERYLGDKLAVLGNSYKPRTVVRILVKDAMDWKKSQSAKPGLDDYLSKIKQIV